ncbi:MAG: hypothetical protein HQ592_17255 [Planctomycetes bacterium]|nr:hypothetical protein [Planctomycetota bacterium]
MLFASVGVGYAVAARRRLSVAPFIATSACVGAILSAVATLNWQVLSSCRAANANGLESEKHADDRRWMWAILPAFMCVGSCQILLQEISLRELSDALSVRAPLTLAAGGIFLWGVAAVRGQWPSSSHLRIGAVTGVVVAVGNITAFAALDYEGHSGVRTLLPIPWLISSISAPWNSSSIRATWFTQHLSFDDTLKPHVVLSPSATIRLTGSERISI